MGAASVVKLLTEAVTRIFATIGPADFEGAKEFKQVARSGFMAAHVWRMARGFHRRGARAHEAAFDALLQWVEDPPERVVYCFATTEIKSIPPALRSRLALLEIRPLDAASAIGFLRRIAEKEDIDCEPEALHCWPA